jgi:hypothetical protein
MHKPVVAVALGLGLLLAGCAGQPRPKLPEDQLALTKACASWRWIAVTSPSAAQCPAVAGWRAQPLFQADNREAASKGNEAEANRPPSPGAEAAVRELRRFCAYEIADPRARLTSLPFPPAASSELVRFDQDCAAIVPAAGHDLTAETGWRGLSGHFLAQAGQPSAPMDLDDRPGVRLAFLDTQPTGIGAPTRLASSLHGYTLAHIARHLVCSPEDSDRCAAQITTRLALPLLRFDAGSQERTKRNSTDGGGIGMQSDLAAAIVDEVDAWRRALARPDAPRHLVLNLSLAWDPRLFGGLDEERIAELRSGTQAVYRALRYAETHGALVLAAAGNRTACGNRGPLLPAAWESRDLPEEPGCEKRSAPLLYAVGGVRSDGQPLDNARVGGMPRRAAIGDHGVVAAPDGDHSTWLYSGSSVATAVVSSTAAVIWDTLPDLGAREVMEILDRSGDPLDFAADFWFGGGAAPGARRVSVCTALRSACAGRPSADCPLAAERCEGWEPAATAFPSWATQPISTTCHPWVVQQPEDPPCPPCDPDEPTP